jgi:hypothetical protein
MSFKELASRNGGYLVCGNRGVLGAQPVAEVFGGTDDLVDEGGGVSASQENANQRVKERTEGAGTKASKVVRSLKD